MRDTPVLSRMNRRIRDWETTADDKALFLTCYMRMTGNVLAAVENDEFNDPIWVSDLLNHFAEYYFAGLEAYESKSPSTPAVWRTAHDLACDADVSALSKLLLGVNAHINYDLVLALRDKLQPEWSSLDTDARKRRYQDHCHVNSVIGRTIDVVQDEVLEPEMPIMDLIDKLLGPVDEFLISRLIAHWREGVWRNATKLLAAGAETEQTALIRLVEADTLKTATLICGKASRDR